VYRLRRKLEAEPGHPRLLHTIPGVGILLKAPSNNGSLAVGRSSSDKSRS